MADVTASMFSSSSRRQQQYHQVDFIQHFQSPVCSRLERAAARRRPSHAADCNTLRRPRRLRPHSTTPTSSRTRPTRLLPCADPREDVGVDVVECGFYWTEARQISTRYRRIMAAVDALIGVAILQSISRCN